MKSALSPLALLLSSLILAACAAEPPAPAKATGVASASSTDSQSEKFCSREYPTGSNIPITVCRTKEQIEAEKAAGTESLRRQQTGGPNAKPGGGG